MPFWRWSDAAVDHAILRGTISSVFGWQLHTAPGVNSRSLRNFPMQANGAEMLRLACCLGTERGIELCAPVHDAVLIAAPLYRLEEDVAAMQVAMREASSVVLGGFELTSDARLVRYPDLRSSLQPPTTQRGWGPSEMRPSLSPYALA
jgi:DNA polymerase I